MIWPLAVTYILANIIFQLIVINSMWVRESHITVTDVVTCWGQNSSHWYDFITLQHYGVVWYFHPLFWALVFSAFQALSHLFEGKCIYFFSMYKYGCVWKQISFNTEN